MFYKKIGLVVVFAWFLIGGMAHFIGPTFFLQIIPPTLPYRMPAVYISGFFELLGALGILFVGWRRAAGIGLFILTLLVTPANVYMWRNPQLFPSIPEYLLAFRLVLQIALLFCIWWSTSPARISKSHKLD